MAYFRTHLIHPGLSHQRRHSNDQNQGDTRKRKAELQGKGDLLWTVKITDEEGKELAPLEDISSEVCLRYLTRFVREVSSKKVSKARPSKKNAKAKTVAKKNLNLATDKKEQSPAAALKTLAMDDDI